MKPAAKDKAKADPETDGPFQVITEDGQKLIVGKLHYGFKVKDVVHKDFAMRISTAGDMFDAEQSVPPARPLAFNAELMCRQLVRIGSFEGPFTLGMLRPLRPTDFSILRAAQLQAEELGEA